MGQTDVTHALILQWGLPFPGREGKAVGLYRATWEWWLELKEAGRIAEVRIYGPLTGTISRRAGFMLVEGSHRQIEELRSSEDFRRTLSRFGTLVQDVHVELLETGDAMHDRIARYDAVVNDTVR
jgi:hypothetical protein